MRDREERASGLKRMETKSRGSTAVAAEGKKTDGLLLYFLVFPSTFWQSHLFEHTALIIIFFFSF